MKRGWTTILTPKKVFKNQWGAIEVTIDMGAWWYMSTVYVILCKQAQNWLRSYQEECIWVEWIIYKKKFLIAIGTFYRPPNSEVQKWNLIAYSMEKDKDTNISNVIITVNFKDNLYNFKSWSFSETNFYDYTRDHHALTWSHEYHSPYTYLLRILIYAFIKFYFGVK